MHARITYTDAALPHQIVLKTSQGGIRCAVTCNCRDWQVGMPAFGEVAWGDLQGAWKLYDNPDLHDHTSELFLPGSRSPKHAVLVMDV